MHDATTEEVGKVAPVVEHFSAPRIRHYLYIDDQAVLDAFAALRGTPDPLRDLESPVHKRQRLETKFSWFGLGVSGGLGHKPLRKRAYARHEVVHSQMQELFRLARATTTFVREVDELSRCAEGETIAYCAYLGTGTTSGVEAQPITLSHPRALKAWLSSWLVNNELQELNRRRELNRARQFWWVTKVITSETLGSIESDGGIVAIRLNSDCLMVRTMDEFSRGAHVLGTIVAITREGDASNSIDVSEVEKVESRVKANARDLSKALCAVRPICIFR